MTRSVLQRAARAIAVTAILGIAPATLLAQESQSAAIPSGVVEETRAPAPGSPTQLGVADIPREAEAARSEIRRLLDAAQPGETVEQVPEQLALLEAELADLSTRLDSTPLERVGLRRLVRLEHDWERPGARLERWRLRLEETTTQQQQGLESLKQIEKRWQGILSEFSDDTAAVAVLDRVSQVVDLAGEAASDVAGQLAQVLDIEDRLIGELAGVRESLGRIAEAREQARDALIDPEQPPLWRMSSESEEQALSVEIHDAFADFRAELSRFVEDNISYVVVHLLLAAGLVVVMFRLRRVSRTRSEYDESFKQVSRVLARPLAGGLLLSLMLTRWIYSNPTETLLKVAMLLALIPLMRLLPSMIPQRFHMALFGAGVLLIIERLESLVAEATPLERVLILVLDLLGLAGLIWMLRAGGTLAAEKEGRLRRISVAAGRVAAALLGAALVANVAGSVALSDLFTEAVYLGAFLALIFLTAYFVLNALILAGLERARVRSVRSLSAHSETIHSWLRWVLQYGFVLWWLYAVVGLFRVRDPVLGFLGKLLGTTLQMGNVSLSIGTVLAFVLTLWISVLLSRIIPVLLEQDVLSRFTLPRGVPGTISTMVRYGVLAVGFLAAAAAAGLEMSQFAILAGSLGVGIGFGLQFLVNNVVSGLILAFERPIQIGDTVETGTARGQVSKIGLRSSILRTFEGAEVIVPNGVLIANEVTNWTMSDRTRRMTVAVGVKYGNDPREVGAILLEAAKQHEKVARYPEAAALFVGFGPSSLNFEVRFWTSHYDEWVVIQSEVAINVYDALAGAGVEIPFPQHDVHLHPIAELSSRESVEPDRRSDPDQPIERPADPGRSPDQTERE